MARGDGGEDLRWSRCLAMVIVAPADCGAVGIQGTVVVVARCYSFEQAAGGITLTKIMVGAPAIDASVQPQSTGVIASRGDLGEFAVRSIRLASRIVAPANGGLVDP